MPFSSILGTNPGKQVFLVENQLNKLFKCLFSNIFDFVRYKWVDGLG